MFLFRVWTFISFIFSYISTRGSVRHLWATSVRCSFCELMRRSVFGKTHRKVHGRCGCRLLVKSALSWHSDSTSYSSYLISVFFFFIECPTYFMRSHKKTFLWALVYGRRDQSRIIMVPSLIMGPSASLALLLWHSPMSICFQGSHWWNRNDDGNPASDKPTYLASWQLCHCN